MAEYEQTKSGSVLKSTSWTTEDAMAMMAEGPVKNKGELKVCMPSGFSADVDRPPQSAADVDLSEYKAAWYEAMKNELDGHKTTDTYQAVTPSPGRKLVRAKWVFTYKTDSDGLTAKIKDVRGLPRCKM